MAAIAPEMLQHVLVLCYYACLACIVIGMVQRANVFHVHCPSLACVRAHRVTATLVFRDVW